MDTELQWEEHRIAISLYLSRKYLWLATETVVRVDDVEVGRTGGFKNHEKVKGTFIHNDKHVELFLESKIDSGSFWKGSLPYTLIIDRNLIAQGRLEPAKRLGFGSCSMILGIILVISFCVLLGSLVLPRIAPRGLSNASVIVTDFQGLCYAEIGILSLLGVLYGILGFFGKKRNPTHAALGLVLSGSIFAVFIYFMITANAGR
jgi:hypothetical protein